MFRVPELDFLTIICTANCEMARPSILGNPTVHNFLVRNLLRIP